MTMTEEETKSACIVLCEKTHFLKKKKNSMLFASSPWALVLHYKRIVVPFSHMLNNTICLRRNEKKTLWFF